MVVSYVLQVLEQFVTLCVFLGSQHDNNNTLTDGFDPLRLLPYCRTQLQTIHKLHQEHQLSMYPITKICTNFFLLSFLGCPQSCKWLFWHFRWCSQSPHFSSGHKSLKLNCCTVSSSLKKKLVDWSVEGTWHKSVKSRRLYCINGERVPVPDGAG